MISSRRLSIAIIVAFTILGGALYWKLVRSQESSDDQMARQLPNTRPDVAYVGDADCRVCHAEIAETYARSEMALSWSEPSSHHLELAERLTEPVEDSALGLAYRTFVRGERLFQEEFRSESDPRAPHSLTRPVRYTVGSGSHGYSFVAERNGYLTLLPLGWYAEAARWDLSPGYERRNARFSREVPIECVACHNSVPDFVEGSRNRYRLPLPAGIGCERCHGPGELHVKAQYARRSSTAGTDPTIVNPARLPVDRQDDVCLQCHLISDVAVLAPGLEWTSFRPGQRLQDVRHDLFVKPEDPAQFGFSSHAARLRLSRCWTDGDTRGSLTCISCHDPHKALREVPRANYVDKCMQCHKSQDCRRKRPDPDPGRDCIDCHMRPGSPANVAHTVFTDHWIRSNPVPLQSSDASFGQPDFGRPLRLTEFWSGTKQPRADVHAIALAKYFDIRQAPDRRQALEELDAALRFAPDHAELHFWRAVTLGTMRQWRLALQSYRAALQYRSDPLTRNGIGEAQRELGLLKESIATLLESEDRYPDFLPTYRELAETYVPAGNLPAAVAALDRSLERFPYQPETSLRAAHLAFLAGESMPQVLARIDEAANLSPDSPSLFWLLGQCLASEGDMPRSIQAYEDALNIDPKYVPALLSLGPALLQAGRIDDAASRMKQLRDIAPNHPMLPSAEQELERHRRRPKP